MKVRLPAYPRKTPDFVYRAIETFRRRVGPSLARLIGVEIYYTRSMSGDKLKCYLEIRRR